jgi:kumamolisin
VAGFRDIVDGNNGAYKAGQGWDACTGLGSPNGTALLARLSPSANPTPPTGPASGPGSSGASGSAGGTSGSAGGTGGTAGGTGGTGGGW